MVGGGRGSGQEQGVHKEATVRPLKMFLNHTISLKMLILQCFVKRLHTKVCVSRITTIYIKRKRTEGSNNQMLLVAIFKLSE